MVLILGRECEQEHKQQRGWEMPFLWLPIEQEKYFPRKPARECSRNIQPSLVCTHIATAIQILYAPTNEYIFFYCCCGWVIWSKICLCAELFLSYILFALICVRILFDFMFTFLKPLFYRHSRRFPGFFSGAIVFDSSSSISFHFLVELVVFVYLLIS